MIWKPETPLREDQTRNPILWHDTISGVAIPAQVSSRFSAERFFLSLFGPGKSKRISTWGHASGDKYEPHWLATRNGTPLHVDPAYPRYSLQVQLCNEGFYTHGLDADPADYPLFTPGLVVLLDTHSPHQVELDPRIPSRGMHKMSAGLDSAEYPDLQAAVGRLVEFVAMTPLSLPAPKQKTA